jgi:hypothetical protein
MTIKRSLAAALTTVAIAAPGAVAQAKPVDTHVPVAQATQDLRSPDARDAARTPSLGGTVSPKQDLRSPDARDAAVPQPDINARGATAVDSSTRPAPAPVPASTGGDGIDWAPIALGLAGALLGIAGLGALAVRHARRVRVPA